MGEDLELLRSQLEELRSQLEQREAEVTAREEYAADREMAVSALEERATTQAYAEARKGPLPGENGGAGGLSDAFSSYQSAGQRAMDRAAANYESDNDGPGQELPPGCIMPDGTIITEALMMNDAGESESKSHGDESDHDDHDDMPSDMPSERKSVFGNLFAAPNGSEEKSLSRRFMPRLLSREGKRDVTTPRTKAKKEKQRATVMKVATEISQMNDVDERTYAREFVLEKDSQFRHQFDAMLVISNVYNLMSVPVYIGFNVASTGIFLVLDTIVDIMFIADLLLNFVTSYKDGKEEVRDRKRIRKHYYATHFWTDAVSALPVFAALLGWFYLTKYVSVPLVNNGGAQDLSATGWVQAAMGLQMVFRGLRITRATKFVKKMNELAGGNPTSIRMFITVGAFIWTAHFLGCAYQRMCILEGYSTRDRSWAIEAKFEHQSLPVRYAHSIYFALVMFGGSQVAKSGTTGQAIFTGASFVLHFLVTAVIIGAATNLLSTMDVTAQIKKQQIDGIQDYLRFRKVPGALHKKISAYYEYLWETGQVAYNEKLFEELPDKLRIELNLTLKQGLIKKVPIFRLVSPAGIIALVQNLRPCIVLPDELIVRQGEKADCMFFVSRGYVQIEHVSTNPVTGEETKTVVQKLKEGAYFGEVALLDADDSERTANVRAVGFCELQVLLIEAFNSLLETYPDFKMAIDKVAEVRIKTTKNLAKMSGGKNKNKLGSKQTTTHRQMDLDSTKNKGDAVADVVLQAAGKFKKGLEKKKRAKQLAADEAAGLIPSAMSHELAIQLVQQQAVRHGRDADPSPVRYPSSGPRRTTLTNLK